MMEPAPKYEVINQIPSPSLSFVCPQVDLQVASGTRHYKPYIAWIRIGTQALCL